MGMVISLAEARPRLRPNPRPDIVARPIHDPALSAALAARDVWVACMSLALAGWGLEVRPIQDRIDGR